jgi:hypothetical protein
MLWIERLTLEAFKLISPLGWTDQGSGFERPGRPWSRAARGFSLNH